MDFNLYKYDDKIFHADELTHRRIKALLLWMEHQAYEKGLGRKGKLKLLNDMINMCVRKEWYEIANFFNEKKDRLRKYNKF